MFFIFALVIWSIVYKYSFSVSGWFGTRHFVTFMLALGMANAYVMRTNMSVAIVAMVNHTAIAINEDSDTDDVSVTECGVRINSSMVTTPIHHLMSHF